MTDEHQRSDIRDQEVHCEERFEDELISYLERGQLVAETSHPMQRALLSKRAQAGMWALRVFAVLVSFLVVYTFIDQLR